MSWRNKIPACLQGGPTDDAADESEAKWLALIQLDLIEEHQDGTGVYTKKEIAQIRRYAAKG